MTNSLKPKLCWTYSHSWRDIPRKEWGKKISILASVESLKDAAKAMKKGYAPMLVVEQHPGEKAWVDEGTGLKVIPCPHDTRGIVCTDCQLCFKDSFLRESNAVIAVAAHGGRKQKVVAAIELVQIGALTI